MPDDFDDSDLNSPYFDCPEDSPYLIRNKAVALLPAHYERYKTIFEQKQAGVTLPFTSTLVNVGDEETREAFVPREESVKLPSKKAGRPRKYVKHYERCYTAKMIGEMLGVTAQQVSRWHQRGLLVSDPLLSSPSITRFNADAVDELIKTGALTSDVKPRYYTAKMIGEMLGVNVQQVAMWIRRGIIAGDPDMSLGYHTRFNVGVIDEMIRDGKLPPDKSTMSSVLKKTREQLNHNSVQQNKTVKQPVALSAEQESVQLPPNVPQAFPAAPLQKTGRKFAALTQLLDELQTALLSRNFVIDTIEFVYNKDTHSFHINTFKLNKSH